MTGSSNKLAWEYVLEHKNLIYPILKQTIRSMAKYPEFVTFDELIAAGEDGIFEAAKNVIEYGLPLYLNPDTGEMEPVAWSTYAKWHIKREIRRAIASQENTIRVPEWLFEEQAVLQKAKAYLTQKLKKEEPTIDELAEELAKPPVEWTREKVVELILLSQRSVTPMSQITPDYDDNMADDLGQNVLDDNFDNITDPIALDILKEVLSSPMLSRREAEILIRSLVYGETFEEIGTGMVVSRQRVQQIQARALRKIRDDSRMRRQADEDLFVPNMRTAHLYRFANRDRSDDEWWAENTVKLEWTEKRKRQWKNGSVPRQMLGFSL
jgi:RNA polymerase sigma factor (sigma-70 family)